uniref:Receptor ligand binding region domain-containing protein n=1 Tax=Laticauda laticaudata TaxID=8630 RepID=A0A8C5S851_LATLA
MVNKTPGLLKNLTLGYNIHDNYLNRLLTSDALLDMFSMGEANVPNYSCGRKDHLLALVDAATDDISIQMSTLVGIYKVPQISFQFFSESLHDKIQLPFYHRLLPPKVILYPAIVQLLLYFRWTLIGLFASDTENGDNFMKTLTPLLVKNGICVVLSQQFSTTGETGHVRDGLSKWTQVNVFLHYIEYGAVFDRILPFHLTLRRLPGPIEGKVWITTLIDLFPLTHGIHLKYIHSIWIVALEEKKWPQKDAFKSYFYVKPPLGDKSFLCFFSKHIFSVKGRKRCIEKEPLDTEKKENMIEVWNFHHYYSTINALAHALNAAYSSRSRRRKNKGKESLVAPRLQSREVRVPDKDPFYISFEEGNYIILVVLVVVSHVRPIVTPWTMFLQAFLSSTIPWSPFKLMLTSSVTPSSHLILCCPLLLLASIIPSISLFSSDSSCATECQKFWPM